MTSSLKEAINLFKGSYLGLELLLCESFVDGVRDHITYRGAIAAQSCLIVDSNLPVTLVPDSLVSLVQDSLQSLVLETLIPDQTR